MQLSARTGSSYSLFRVNVLETPNVTLQPHTARAKCKAVPLCFMPESVASPTESSESSNPPMKISKELATGHIKRVRHPPNDL